MAWGEPDSDAVQPPSAHGSGCSTPNQAAGRYGKDNDHESGYIGHLNSLGSPFILISLPICSMSIVFVNTPKNNSREPVKIILLTLLLSVAVWFYNM